MSAITSYNGLNVKGALVVTGAKSTLAVHAAGYSGLNIPSAATVITTPVSGDIWNLSGVLQFHNGTAVQQILDTTDASTSVSTLTGLQVGVAGSATTFSKGDHQHTVAGVVDTSTTQASIGGAKTFTGSGSFAPATDIVPLTITRGTDTSPAAHLLDIKNHAGTVLSYFDASGALNTNYLITGWITSGALGIASNTTGGFANYVAAEYSADADGPIFNFVKSRSTVIGNVGILSNNDPLGTIAFVGSGTTVNAWGAQIKAEVDGTTINDSSMPGRLTFLTSPSGSAVPVERLRIASSGTTTHTLTTDTVGLIVKGASGQTQDLLQVLNSASVVMGSIEYDGSANFPNLVGVNYFHNGSFAVNQRAIAATTTGIATNTYMLDRWIVNATTAAITCTQNDNAVYSGAPSRYGLLLAGAASNAGVSVAQRIEARDAMHLGRTIMITLWTYNSTGAAMTTPTVTLSNPTTTADTFSALTATGTLGMTLLSGTNSAGASWLKWGLNVDMSGLGAAIARGQEIKFNFQALVATRYIVLAAAKLEVGSAATQFIPLPYQQELALCQRFYYRLSAVNTTTYFGSGRLSTTTNSDFFLKFPVTMRAQPSSASVSSGTHFVVNAASSANSTAAAITVASFSQPDGMLVNCTTSALVAGQGCLVGFNNAAGWVQVSADL